MAGKVKVWYDTEGDYLEILFETKAGTFIETDHDAVMEKVDSEGNLVGLSILNVSKLRKASPVEVSLRDRKE